MTTHAIHKLIHKLDFCDQKQLQKAMSNMGEYLSGFDLYPKEAEAIQKQDFKRLLEMGVHPYLLLRLTRLLGINQEEYTKKL